MSELTERQKDIGVDDDVVTTVSGKLVHFLEPQPGEIDIHDIAHALANQCRFVGNTRPFYSVAQHSLFVSYQVDERIALEALLHDAAEAYLGDIPRPVKRLLPDFQVLSEVLTLYIFREFKCNPGVLSEVKPYDTLALVTEGRDLIDKWSLQTKFGIEAHPEPTLALPPGLAREPFLRRFFALRRT